MSHLAQRIGRHALAIVGFTLPAVILWWHVWTGHPSATLTCPCGDPAQEVWFMAWPAYAISHFANVFYSGSVNVPYGANLLSNTSGSLIGVVLSPVTWLWGPVVSTSVALTLAPGLSAWGCWVALRRFVAWKPGAIPAALVFGYSSAVVMSLIFGHASLSVLVIPPLLLSSLHEIGVRQSNGAVRDGLTLCLLVVVQFLISPEVLVMCALFSIVGGVVALVAALVRGWRPARAWSGHAGQAFGIGLGLSVIVLAYPAWLGQSGPQSVTGVLFALAPLSGVRIAGFLSPGPYRSFANAYVRFGGYTGRNGPPPNYIGWGTAVSVGLSLFFARRRPLAWLLAVMTLVAMWFSLGQYLLGGSLVLSHGWLPWRTLSKAPVLQEILPDQLAPFATLFIAFILALGLDAFSGRMAAWGKRKRNEDRATLVAALATLAVGGLALVPVALTFDIPFTVQSTAVPHWMAHDATHLRTGAVLLTVPFAISGSTRPMLWQAIDDMHFRLAGAALKTPDSSGGPVGQGAPGSARHILAELSVPEGPEPTASRGHLATVRRAVRAWHVNEVVIDGPSRNPAYASGFLTAALGTVPVYVHRAWVWKIATDGPSMPALAGGQLARCVADVSLPAQRRHPLAVADCVRHGRASAQIPA